MKYYNDEIERILISTFNDKLRKGEEFKLISERTGINIEDITDSLLDISLKYIKSNELRFEKSSRYLDADGNSISPEQFFVIFLDDFIWKSLNNLKNYTNKQHTNILHRPLYNAEEAELVLKPARRNTIIKQLI